MKQLIGKVELGIDEAGIREIGKGVGFSAPVPILIIGLSQMGLVPISWESPEVIALLTMVGTNLLNFAQKFIIRHEQRNKRISVFDLSDNWDGLSVSDVLKANGYHSSHIGELARDLGINPSAPSTDLKQLKALDKVFGGDI